MRAMLLLFLCFSYPVCAGTIYQCRDAKGKVTLQDSPCSVTTERVVRSGQDEARDRYLAAGGDINQAYGRGLMYGVTCRIARDAYRSAREAADLAARRGDLREMQDANARVHRAGRSVAEQGC
ncbi:DUF4124 domain-containing protein [Cupriavidus oxalaticus]|uniref:DUF4124 domain-containing protein n=1 Tax=Cupriavidus oxalaticus TaxID=96344 RepID=UPI003F737C0A